jgi:predicted nucleic acid-binding protein
MNAVDSNVFIYRIDPSDPAKQAKARALLKRLPRTTTLLPWQVLGEVTRFLRYWQDQAKITRAGFLRYVTAVRRFFPLALPTAAVLDEALSFSGRFSLLGQHAYGRVQGCGSDHPVHRRHGSADDLRRDSTDQPILTA